MQMNHIFLSNRKKEKKTKQKNWDWVIEFVSLFFLRLSNYYH
jgi:hypothetical protein